MNKIKNQILYNLDNFTSKTYLVLGMCSIIGFAISNNYEFAISSIIFYLTYLYLEE